MFCRSDVWRLVQSKRNRLISSGLYARTFASFRSCWPVKPKSLLMGFFFCHSGGLHGPLKIHRRIRHHSIISDRTFHRYRSKSCLCDAPPTGHKRIWTPSEIWSPRSHWVRRDTDRPPASHLGEIFSLKIHAQKNVCII